MKTIYSFFVLLILILTSCEKKTTLKTIEGNAFGSTYVIKYIGDKNYEKEIAQILQDFDDAVSTYKDSSDVITFNHAKQEVIADGMFLEIFKISQQINQKTMGYFDPSIAPLINLWGFGKEGIKNQPTPQQVDSIKAFVGLEKIQLKGNKIIKNKAQNELNFNSITGYVNDKVAQFFKKNNVNSYLIEIGGEILAKGNKENGEPWRIGLDNPLKDIEEREVLIKFKLENIAFAPSGNYRKYYINDQGKKIVHTINPITGYPEQSEILSAAIFAKTCAEADGIATAIMAMGLKKAELFLANNKDIAAVMIISDEDNQIDIKKYNGVEQFMID